MTPEEQLRAMRATEEMQRANGFIIEVRTAGGDRRGSPWLDSCLPGSSGLQPGGNEVQVSDSAREGRKGRDSGETQSGGG